MATIILKHKVADYDTWKQSYDQDKSRRDAGGMREIAVGKTQDDPNMVYVIAEVADPSAIQGMMADKELQQRMQDAGVQGPPEVVVLA